MSYYWIQAGGTTVSLSSLSDVSPTFPKIPLTRLIPTTIEKSWQVGTVRALEEFEALIDN